jgi:predicted nucleotidyltransferase
MAKEKFEKIRDIILNFMNKKRIGIDKIIIFGSFARGVRKKEGDIDVIIVSRDLEGKDVFEKVALMSDVHVELVKKLKKPFDIRYYSDKEWDSAHSLIINTAKQEGEIIYG